MEAKAVYGRHVKHKNPPGTTYDQKTEEKEGDPSGWTDRFRSVAEQVADSDIYSVNWAWPGAALDFPHEPWMRAVTRYFKYAKGGPLCIDMPYNEVEVKECERRGAFVKKHGFRYICIRPGQTFDQVMTELTVPKLKPKTDEAKKD